ncbi:MAG: hypothetical protein FWE42_05535, partial [Defluviitaleaceae bacterium]|nr:hypothetical protein [Defluviitaleaceae bacterium]
NQGGFFDACQEGKLEKANAEWCKSDRQGDIEPYEHSFLYIAFGQNDNSALCHLMVCRFG